MRESNERTSWNKVGLHRKHGRIKEEIGGGSVHREVWAAQQDRTKSTDRKTSKTVNSANN